MYSIMDNKDYEIRRDYLEGWELLESLRDVDRQKVELAIAGLAKEPWPKGFSAKEAGDETVKITVPVENDELTVLYEVDVYESIVDLIRIKRRGPFKKAGEWLAGLMKFEPRG
jgi:hypothetical protein